MTGVVFAPVAIAANGAETVGSNFYAIMIRDVALSTIGVKKAIPVPGRRMGFIPMGDEGPQIKFSARLYGSGITGRNDQASQWAPYTATSVMGSSLLKATSSEYTLEIPVNSYWWVDTVTMKRNNGSFAIYETDFSFFRSFYDINDNERST